MKQQLRVRTNMGMSIPPHTTLSIPIRRNRILKPDEHLTTLRFVPRCHIPHLRMKVQVLRHNQTILQATNEASSPIWVPKNTVLGKFRPPLPFRFDDLPRELQDMILDLALADAHPSLKVLTLKAQPGFIKTLAQDGSISLVPRYLPSASKNKHRVFHSIAYPFELRCNLALVSKSMAEIFQNALWRFLIREESSWLQLRVRNFDFDAAQKFLRDCSAQQLEQLRVPGKLVLQLSIRGWSSRTQIGWCTNIQNWSLFCKMRLVNPWMIFTRAFFLQRRDQVCFQDTLATRGRQAGASKKGSKVFHGQQLDMIVNALLDIGGMNGWTKTGYNISVHERAEDELTQEEYYFKGAEFDSDGFLAEGLPLKQQLLENCPASQAVEDAVEDAVEG